MDRNYLLTYLRQGIQTYGWYETLEEMVEFIEGVCVPNDYQVIEKYHIKEIEELK